MQGRLITIEGIDGVGKTTHARQLLDWLRAHRKEEHSVHLLREPGGTELGEALRGLLKQEHVCSPLAELLLFCAARAELVETILRPALARGSYVILDRFTDSSLAYQGALDQISSGQLEAITSAATGGLKPDLTFWLDLPPAAAFARIVAAAREGDQKGGRDSFERRGQAYFERVRKIYQSICDREPQRVARIDADGAPEQVHTRMLSVLEARMAEWNNG